LHGEFNNDANTTINFEHTMVRVRKLQIKLQIRPLNKVMALARLNP